MSMHYRNHYDSLKKNMGNNNLLRLVTLRPQKVYEYKQRRLQVAKKNNALTGAKKSKLVSLLTLRGKKVKQNNQKLIALVTLRGKIINQNNEKRQAAILHKFQVESCIILFSIQILTPDVITNTNKMLYNSI